MLVKPNPLVMKGRSVPLVISAEESLAVMATLPPTKTGAGADGVKAILFTSCLSIPLATV